MIHAYSEQLLKAHFPSCREPTDEAFELAIACCGGIAAGPYVSGVLDFLWEAFEEWRAAAKVGTAPAHNVRIRNLVGASAGGLGVGLAAVCSLKKFPHVYHDELWKRYEPDQKQLKCKNPHYNAWVKEITFTRLLSHPREVRRGQIYLFHSTPTEICDSVLEQIDKAPDAEDRDFVYDPLELRVTIGNLKGVPYSLDFGKLAVGGSVSSEWLEMHRDNAAFAFRTDRVGGVDDHGLGAAPDCHELGLDTFPAEGEPQAYARSVFRAAMIATSAVPLVFKVTEVPQDPRVYDWRAAYWDVHAMKAVVDRPAFGKPPANPFNYAATDGGLFDNLPFNLAHQRLAGARGQNPQEATKAWRAVILVDPLAEDRAPPPSNPNYDQVFSVIAKLVLSPVLQDRLDTLDLAQINDETIFSRFMISPSRRSPDRRTKWPPSRSLLGAPLNAFLGFAEEAYREHDFLLGRRNAQQFLRRHFCLPVEHKLVADRNGWTAEDLIVHKDEKFYPLVPLRGRAADEQPEPDWNWQALTDPHIERYGRLVSKRANAIFSNLKCGATAGFGGVQGLLARLYLDIGWLFARPMIVASFKAALRKARAGLDPGLDRTRPPVDVAP